MDNGKPLVGLFVTCIVDLMRPSIGFAAIKLLQCSGCSVDVPAAQTCCGQPAYNSGDNKTSRAIARQVINAFESFDYVVAPSGSCAAMIKVHYPELFDNDPFWLEKANSLAEKTYELTSFLVDIRNFDLSKFRLSGDTSDKTLTYHDSCSGYRELGIYSQPRDLLKNIGCTITEMENSRECCGFGGTFCVKYADISNAMVSDKVDDIKQTDTKVVLGGDYSCLMNIAGKLNRNQATVQAAHVAEFIADMIPDTSD